MGMILYSLLAGRKPFEDQKSLELAISEGRRPVMDSSWHRDFVEVRFGKHGGGNTSVAGLVWIERTNNEERCTFIVFVPFVFE